MKDVITDDFYKGIRELAKSLDNDLQEYGQKKAFKITKAAAKGKITADKAQEALKRIDEISLAYIRQEITLKEAKRQIDNTL